jgi:predicted dehydrogenase
MSTPAPPRLGFLGVGWIGRHRLEAVHRSGLARVAAVCDADQDATTAAMTLAPGARRATCLDEMLALDLDGLVIATPNVCHAEQSVRALERGLAVFCQKPLGRTAAETREVVETARRQDRLLGVDLSYRFVRGLQAVRALREDGSLGEVYAADLVFHNAYGPDKPWFYDRRLSGGGALLDLGIHLVDLAGWLLGGRVEQVSSHLYANGRPLHGVEPVVEDYVTATLRLDTGAVCTIACSWKLPAGTDAMIRAAVYGTGGGGHCQNVNGSFYDFRAEHTTGTTSRVLAEPPDPWMGGAILDWAARLATSRGFDPAAAAIVEVAEVIDAIYRASHLPAASVRGAGTGLAATSR